MGAGPIYLAFRVFGNFHWPPVRKDFDVSTDDTGKILQKGAVEIYYAALDPGKPYQLAAFLRWRKGIDTSSPSPPIDDLRKALDIQSDDDVLKNAFGNDSALFQLSGTAPKPGKARRLLFRGAFLFDQLSLDAGDPAKPALDLRWALARSFLHYDSGGNFGSNFFSELVIGQDQDLHAPGTPGASIRFNLALPTPGAQSGDDHDRCYALPFGAIFRPTLTLPPKGSVTPLTDTFLAGPGPADSLQDDTVSPQGRVNARLGQFGFCAGKQAGGDQFLYFPRGSGEVKNFWPTSARAFVGDFLSVLSKSAHPHPERYLELNDTPDRYGEFVHSVRFPSGSAKSVITFRTAVTIPHPVTDHGQPPALLTDDIRVDWPGFLGEYRPYSFQLRLPDQPNKWLHTQTDTLYIEREISYTIADNEIWSLLDTQKIVGDITVRLGFAEKQADVRPLRDTIFLQAIFDRAAESMPEVRFGLRDIADGQPQSILPDVGITWPDLPVNPAPWDIPATPRFMFSGQMPFRFRPSAKADGPLTPDRQYPDRNIWAGLDINLSLWPSVYPITTEPVTKELDVTMKMASFSYQPTQSLALQLIADPSVPSGDQPPWCRFKLVPDTTRPPTLMARLGGLQFDGATISAVDNSDDYSYWRFGHRASGKTPDLPLANVDFRLRLQVGTVTPIVTDTPWGDRSNGSAPLLIPLGDSAGGGHFLLDLRETLAKSQDRRLQASLYDTGSGTSDRGDFVILSDEPFSLVRLHAQPLQQRGTQDNTLVASFDSDTRQWQVKVTTDTYHYAFPPQVAGESMDKPRRLEIADDSTPSYPSAVMPPARHPEDGNGNPFPVEFRLTPSAEIWIRPSDLERGYFLPEWASHEIFRQRGDLGIGAALAALRGEFLYGLSVGVDPSRETGASRSARIAEIEALVGRPPGKPATANDSTPTSVRWAELDRVIARRPERVEIWARDPNSSVPLAPASFSDGVAFSLRRTALHRPPLLLDSGDADDPNTGKPRYSEKGGLSGGALWPLESRNFFNSLVDNPTSVGGTIEQIALSPIGGDANQKAEFLNGKVRIISETRDGFVQRHKIEIIGRISVFWHWAKYVVVYERTVNPSAQFTPDANRSDLGDRTRRPVLRKVSEYVYIRQSKGIRRYPDFPAADARSSGLLKAVKFNSITINVDSAWSEDVGKYGWQLPLWNRFAAQRRPQVYPRPDIAFSAFAEGEGEEAETSQECIEPDNIYFYADASPDTGDDTDTWPSLAGVDCSLLPPPSHAFQRDLDQSNGSDGTGTRPSASRIPRGHRRFTWRLSPPSKKTTLNAGRSEKPLFAELESITFMRSNAGSGAITPMTDALNSADSIKPPANKLLYWPEEGKAPAAFAEVDDFLAAVKAHDSTQVNTTVLKLGDALMHQIATRPGIQDGITAAKEYATKLDPISKFALADPTSRCQRMADDLVGSIRRKQLLIIDAVNTWQAEAEAAVPATPPQPQTVDQLIDDLLTDAQHGLAHAVTRAFGEIGFDPGQVNLGVEKARNILAGFEEDVRDAETTLQAQLNSLRAAYDDKKPWSTSRIQDFEAKWIANGTRVFDSISTAIEEGGVRVTTELDSLAQTIANTLHDALLSLVEGGSTLKDDINRACALPAAYLDAGIKKLEAFLDTSNGKDTLAQLDDKLASFQASVQAKYPSQANTIGDVRRIIPRIRTSAPAILTTLQDIKSNNPQIKITDLVDTIVGQGAATLGDIANTVSRTRHVLAELVNDDTVKPAIDLLEAALADFTVVVDASISFVSNFGSAIDGLVNEAFQKVQATLHDEVFKEIDGWFTRINDAANYVSDKLTGVTEQITSGFIATTVTEKVLRPALRATLTEITDAAIADYSNSRKRIIELIGDTSGYVQSQINSLGASVLGDAQQKIVQACSDLADQLNNVVGDLQNLESEIEDRANEIVKKWQDQVLKNINDFGKLEKIAADFATDVRRLSNDIATSYASAKGYGNRVLEAAGNLGSGGIGAVPGNILRLYAAAASAPALPNLDFDRDRLAYYYGQLNDVIDTTPAEAWFGRLGDELKALGLSLPFQKLGESVIPDDLSNFDISRIFKNFSGMKLDKLFDGYKLPPGAGDAIKLTHAFDKAQARAWVEIDVDLPMTDRKAMFSVGPFELDYVNSRFVAMVRLEASKDTNTVNQIGRAALTTDLEAVVGGETMVTFQQVGLHYEKSSGLKVEFDPKKIRLNAIFQFIEETLGSIFPDELGGLKIIKEFGIPVGIEHEFAMPPISLNYATSGVSNICINNRFGLVAFPEFVIYDRFSLSRPELPFIFSIFIIGGTGYISVEAEYHPFRDKGNLMVMVEAAAGGSAQLGFAFGPVSGQVLITLSVALTYRKVFGAPGGGLTISLVLLIAGNVDIAGIVTIYIGLLLRMSYQDNGAIDAMGTLTVTIHITRFFKIEVSANVQYRLRGGQSQTTTSVHAGGGVGGRALNGISPLALQKAREKADRLMSARG
jgi:hypothetical protein